MEAGAKAAAAVHANGPALSNSERIAAFVKDMHTTGLSDQVLDAAKMCLVDWLAVCIGARRTPEAAMLARYAAVAGESGSAPLLIGGSGSAQQSTLINGTLSHCLDYDDTHIPTALHASGPTWAAVLAVGSEAGSTEDQLLKAFTCGFEVGATAGSEGFGVRLNENGWHSTSVLGRISSASAVAFLLNLEGEAVEYAVGLAGTQAGGLTASFGTMAKPFHAGKAGMDGVIAAQMAGAGLVSSDKLLDSPKGLFGTIFQDRQSVPTLETLRCGNEILKNSLKPYAACQLTHAPIDAAIGLRGRLNGAQVESIVIHVHPLAIEIAGVTDPKTSTAARFSSAYCVALGLLGYPISPDDFELERIADPKLTELAKRVSLAPASDVSRTAARLEAVLQDGSRVNVDIEHAFGSVGNPVDWAQLEKKFHSLVEPVVGAASGEFFDVLANFERPGSFQRCLDVIGGLSRMGA